MGKIALFEGHQHEHLLTVLAEAPAEADPMSLPLSDEEKGVLAAALLQDEEPVTKEDVDWALRVLWKKRFEHEVEAIKSDLNEATAAGDQERVKRLYRDKKAIDAVLEKMA